MKKRRPFWCWLFGCKFREVLTRHEWAFFGIEYEFSKCMRLCGTPNPRWSEAKDYRAESFPLSDGSTMKRART